MAVTASQSRGKQKQASTQVSLSGKTEALMRSIVDELGEADSFRRDDLLFISAFDHVSTITRYAYVCKAVRELVSAGKLYEYGQYELILPAKEKAYIAAQSKQEEYHNAIKALVYKHGKQWSIFSVGDVLQVWQSDQHLTDSVKRTILRTTLRHLTKEGVIHNAGSYRYTVHSEMADV